MSIFDEISQIVGPANVYTDKIECLCNSRDMSVHHGIADGIVFARTTEQVAAVMKLASRDKIPVTPEDRGPAPRGPFSQFEAGSFSTFT